MQMKKYIFHWIRFLFFHQLTFVFFGLGVLFSVHIWPPLFGNCLRYLEETDWENDDAYRDLSIFFWMVAVYSFLFFGIPYLYFLPWVYESLDFIALGDEIGQFEIVPDLEKKIIGLDENFFLEDEKKDSFPDSPSKPRISRSEYSWKTFKILIPATVVCSGVVLLCILYILP